MMKYILISLLFIGCSVLQKKETPVIAAPEPIVEREAVEPLVEKVTIMISSFAKGDEQMTLEPKTTTDRKKLVFFIERLENDTYLKLDFEIIPIKTIVRYKAEVITKKYSKDKAVTETTKFVVSTSNKNEFIQQLKNIVNK